jgi:putative zinc finger protein
MKILGCQEIVALLSPALDGALSLGESRAVWAHRSSCPECARQFVLLSETREAFRSSMAEPAARPRSVTVAALVAATVAAIVVAIMVTRFPERSPQLPRNGDAAADCGLPGPASCIVEAPPCSGVECAPLLVPQ